MSDPDPVIDPFRRSRDRSPVVFEDINVASRPYEPLVAYGQSKTANVLFAVEAFRRWADEGITANAVHPGAIATTNLSRYLEPAELERIKASGLYRYKTPEQGAATSVLVATSPQLEGIGGRYFQDCNEGPVVDASTAETTGAQVFQHTHPSFEPSVPTPARIDLKARAGSIA